MKKIFALLIIVIMVLALISACSSSPTDSQEASEIRIADGRVPLAPIPPNFVLIDSEELAKLINDSIELASLRKIEPEDVPLDGRVPLKILDENVPLRISDGRVPLGIEELQVPLITIGDLDIPLSSSPPTDGVINNGYVLIFAEDADSAVALLAAWFNDDK